MPRDGSGVYTLPTGTTAVTDTTIESTKYNAFTGDVQTDLNAVRPIIAGGTGASNPTAARQNMQAERSEQQISNYDSHAYETGSFWSAAGATSAPNGTDSFTGQITRVADGAADKWTVVARSRQSGIAYIRQKVGGGAWSAWTTEGSDKLSKVADDTTVGNITISKTLPTLVLNKSASGDNCRIEANTNGSLRWRINMGNGSAEAGGNQGSDFILNAIADNGVTVVGAALSIARSNALIGLAGDPTLPLGAATKQSSEAAATAAANAAAALRVAKAGDTMTGGLSLQYSDPTISLFKTAAANVAQMYIHTGVAPRWLWRFNEQTNDDCVLHRYNAGGAVVDQPMRIAWATGAVTHSGNLQAMGYLQSSSGLIYCDAANASGNAYVYLRDHVGTAQNVMYWERATNRFIISNTGGERLVIENGGALKLGVGFNSRAGISGAYTGSVHNFVWTGALQAWIDGSNVGNVTLTSDYRIKKDVEDLPGMWDTVKALRPVKYTHADYTPQIELEARAKAAADRAAAGLPPEPDPGPFIRGDNILRYGFIAHELQQALVPSAASGVKDQPNAIQALNIDVTVAALTKALQEAMTRIEALEAKLATP